MSFEIIFHILVSTTIHTYYKRHKIRYVKYTDCCIKTSDRRTNVQWNAKPLIQIEMDSVACKFHWNPLDFLDSIVSTKLQGLFDTHIHCAIHKISWPQNSNIHIKCWMFFKCSLGHDICTGIIFARTGNRIACNRYIHSGCRNAFWMFRLNILVASTHLIKCEYQKRYYKLSPRQVHKHQNTPGFSISSYSRQIVQNTFLILVVTSYKLHVIGVKYMHVWIVILIPF